MYNNFFFITFVMFEIDEFSTQWLENFLGGVESEM